MSYKLKKVKELRLYNNEELKKMLQDIGATQMLLRGAQAAGGGINPGQLRNIKKTKARILTILGERKSLKNGKQKGGFRRRS